MTESNTEVVKKGYDAFAAGDAETALGLFDDDIEWIEPGESAISGTYHGKGAVAQLLIRMAEKGLTATPIRFVAEGDSVVALSTIAAGHETSQAAEVFTLRNGKVVRVQIYSTDTGFLDRVFGNKQDAPLHG